MSILAEANIVVLDLETLHSADDCRHCGAGHAEHYADGACMPWACMPWEGEKPSDDIYQFSAIGWENKLALGLSIGCYWDYGQNVSLHWFDPSTLEATMRLFVEQQPLLVSFNGISFDFALMRALLRHRGENTGFFDLNPHEDADAQFLYDKAMRDLCDTFKAQCATSYDILREIWKVDPKNKFGKGLNSLAALCQANGLPAKEMDGATAPRLWAQGRYAEVIGYNVGDVLRTKALFEMICAGQPILRGDGLPIVLPVPSLS